MMRPLRHQCPECGRDCFCAIAANEGCIHDCGGELDEDEDDEGAISSDASCSLWDSGSPGEAA